MRRRLLPIGLVLVAVALPACSDSSDEERVQSDQPPDRALTDVGTCRSNLARSESQGRASVDWVPLSAEVLRPPGAVVVVAESLDDDGERDYPQTESGGDLEPAHAVDLVGAVVLAGDRAGDREVRVTPFQLTDAQAVSNAGGSLLLRIPPAGEHRFDYATVVGITSTGDVVFPGDCHPLWASAFAKVAERMGEKPANLIRELYIDPDGPKAKLFSTMPGANAPGGPWDPGREVPASGPELNVAYRHQLYVHCGVRSTTFAGRLWLADPPLADDSGNPPPNWGENSDDGTFTLVSDDEAVYRSVNGPTVTFRAAPPGTPDPNAGCD